MDKKRRGILGTITVSTICVVIVLQIFGSTIAFLWGKLLNLIWPNRNKKPSDKDKV
jgi:hypothetical protein